MAGQAGLVGLSAGSVLRLDGTEWTVSSIEAQHGRVLLSAGEDERWRSIRWLVHHPGCQAVPDGAAERARPAGQPPGLGDLTGYQRQVVRLRIAHLLEAETGFCGGDPLRPGPGEPRPAYDPGTTTLGQRRREVIIATTFGMKMDAQRKGARPEYVLRAAEDSLRRLGTD